MRQQDIRNKEAGMRRADRRKGARRGLLLAAIVAMGIVPAVAGQPAGRVAAAASVAEASAAKAITQTVRIGGQTSSIPALNQYGTTYVALRVLNEKLGLATSWDAKSGLVTVEGRGRTLTMDPKTGQLHLNGQRIYGLPAIVQNRTTYLPLRFLLERMGYTIGYDAASRTIDISAILENELTIANEKIAESDEKRALNLEINYPRIEGLANADAQSKINDYLKAEAEAQYKYGIQLLNDSAADNAAYAADNPGERLLPVEFDGNYTITYNEKGKLSLYVDYYEYTGGAHGMTARAPYTFDLSDGHVLTLKEAALNNADYVDIINEAVREGIKRQQLEPLLTPFETIEPDRPFYLNHNGLVVYFEQYEYTPFAAGMPEFVIPLKAFE